MTCKKFLVRPFIKPDESFCGYVNRLAKDNYVNVNDMFHINGKTIRLQTSDQAERKAIKQRLFLLTGHTRIDQLFDIRSVSSSLRSLFDYRQQKVCISCLWENPYIRALWDFKNYNICHIHRTALVSHCVKCNKKLTISSALSRFCNECNLSLREHGHQNIGLDPISLELVEIIAREPSQISKQLEQFQQRLKNLRPYIRVANEGYYQGVDNLRMQNATEFSTLQTQSVKLAQDEDLSVEVLAKQLAVASKRKAWSSCLSDYREVFENPTKYQFSDVLKRVLTEQTTFFSEKELTLELLSKLWQIDEQQLLQVIEDICPAILVRNKRLRIKCSDLAKYHLQIFERIKKA